MFDNSKWIGFNSKNFSGDICTTPCPYIAKTFTLKETPKKATLNICGIGDGAYFINGERIPDSIRPTFVSDIDKTIIYNVFDVTKELKKGKNRIGAILGSLRVNNGPYAMEFPLMLILELNVTYNDGTDETIVTDESFKGHDSSIIFSATTAGERQDARLEIKDWCNEDFDDSNWEKVCLVTPPKGKFRTTDCPPKRIIAQRKFKEIAPKLFDCGITTSGYARMKITGKAGTLIKLNYSERLLPPENKHVDRSAFALWKFPDMYNSDEYILDGTKDKVFDQYMAFHGFRYVEVVGDYEDIELTAVIEHTDIKSTSYFECDNDIINKIHFACTNSVKTCCQDVFVDNPKRDSSWIGDTMLSSEVILSEFDGKNILIENARLCHDAMDAKGQLPYSVPFGKMAQCSKPVGEEGKWGFSKRFSGPDWGNSVVFQTVYWIYKYFGDLKPFMEFREDLERSFGFFASIADEDGYIGDGGYATGDWSSLYLPVRARDDIMSNVYYKWDADIMAELSELAGYDRTPYDALSKKIKTAFRNRYMPNGEFKEVSNAELITLGARGFFEEDEMPGILERIAESFKKDNYLITFGVHGIKMMWDFLADNGYTDLLFKVLINADGLGYAKNAVDGLTALPERFDYSVEYNPTPDTVNSGMVSMNHHFFSMVDTFLFRRLAGIMVNDFASGDIVISPLFVDEIKTLKAEFCGIKVAYDEKEIKINSPFGFKLVLGGETRILSAGEYSISR